MLTIRTPLGLENRASTLPLKVLHHDKTNRSAVQSAALRCKVSGRAKNRAMSRNSTQSGRCVPRWNACTVLAHASAGKVLRGIDLRRNGRIVEHMEYRIYEMANGAVRFIYSYQAEGYADAIAKWVKGQFCEGCTFSEPDNCGAFQVNSPKGVIVRAVVKRA